MADAKSNGRVPIRAVAYYRMSDDKQEASIPAQRKAVEDYARSNGFQIIREYLDQGISGDDTGRRIGFQQMIRDAAMRGDFEVVLCWDQDRFGRFDPIEGGYWIKPMRDAGVRLETIGQGPIDWNDFAGRIVWTVNQEAKRAYLSDLSRNVLRGHVEAAKRGEWLGGPPPYGYAVERKRLVPGPADRRETVRRIFVQYLDGMTLRRIAGDLNAGGIPSPQAGTRRSCSGRWSATGVRSILTNRAYLGEYQWNRSSRSKYFRVRDGRPEARTRGEGSKNDSTQWVTIPDNHPALIDRETFDRVQEKLARNQTRTTPGTDGDFLLTGLLRCGCCGSRMHGLRKGACKYSCAGYAKFGRRSSPEDAGCEARFSVAEEKLVGLICESLQAHVQAPGMRERIRAELEEAAGQARQGDQAADLRRQIADVGQQLESAKRRLLEVDSDMVEVVQERIRSLRDDRRRFEELLRAAVTPVDRLLADQERRIDRAVDLMGRLFEAVQHSERRLAREFFAAAIDHVDLNFQYEDRGSRRFNFLEGGRIFLADSEVSELLSPASRSVQVSIPFAVPACELPRRFQRRRKVFAALGPHPVTMRDLRRATGLSPSVIREALESLQADGAAERCGIERRGQMRDGYRLSGIRLAG